MKSILKTAAASLALAAMAAVSSPVFAHQDRVELRFGNGYDQQRTYVQPGVIYETPAPVYRYRDGDGWRQQQWRERAWRERERERRAHYWREQNELREHLAHEEHDREHERLNEQHERQHERLNEQPDRDHYGDWR